MESQEAFENMLARSAREQEEERQRIIAENPEMIPIATGGVTSFQEGGDTVIDITVSNRPGLYFLFNQEYKLIYIGESLFPLSRILDHYWKAYLNGKDKKGIGPVFSYFRIISLNNETRIRQHYETRYIKHYNPEHNHGTNRAP